MNIAHIVYQFPKISETFILNQITGLMDLGYIVDLYAFRSSDEDKIHPDVFKYDLLSSIKYFRIPHNIISRLGLFVFNLLSNPVKNMKAIISLKSISKSRYYLINNFFIFSCFSKNYHILHCHYGTLGKRFLFLKEICPKTRLVVSFHGFDITKIIKEYGEDYYTELFSKADLFLPISNYWKKRLIDLGCSPSKISILRMGVNLDLFHFKPRSPKFPLKFLTVGRLVEKKGVQYAIEAFAKILSQDSTFSFEYFIAGDGPLKSFLNNLIKNLGLEDKIRLLGWVSQDEVQRLMNKSHLFLLPSVTASDGDQEGIPVVLMEAMASGLPVISTFHSGIPELIINGETGFLVPEKDSGALANKILYLSQNPNLWPRIAKNARNFVEKEYNIKKQTRKLINFYKNILKNER